MSLTVCLAPARTIDYPEGSGHLWVYLQWALALRALGCRVIWLEGVDPSARGTPQASKPRHLRAGDPRKLVPMLRARLQPYGLAESLALFSLPGDPLPPDVAAMALDLDAAATADLLVNLWHSLPARVVRRFRRSAFVDTDPGLLQIWMSTGDIAVAPHDLYFTIGETVGAPGTRFPDCGLRWHYTPPPVFLPEWPQTAAEPGAPYTTLTHWWGGTFDYRGVTFSNEKRAAFLEFARLPSTTSAKLELAICLGRHYEEWRGQMEPLGWTIREAWDVSATPDHYRAYIQQSRGEFSCAKPAYVTLQAGWISDRTICYLASGKPAIVQHTGPSRFLPDADGLFRFRNLDEAGRALDTAESEYDRHCRQARALAEEHFDARRVVGRVLEHAVGARAPHSV
ncbi:MAG: hypothetical protein E6H05_08210 [Bacillati bacterium ANGP1]|uniref:Glycosyltransferase family 1 protein n=1 Tax=Candidatus Segetimicrobium genomatis TaxID=2569760 RepID=A0A537IRK7_9BACT|nr:MAG: hypothetical protein E6H05_08210 [Terrabacteria group bacterium ANGP1]